MPSVYSQLDISSVRAFTAIYNKKKQDIDDPIESYENKDTTG